VTLINALNLVRAGQRSFQSSVFSYIVGQFKVKKRGQEPCCPGDWFDMFGDYVINLRLTMKWLAKERLSIALLALVAGMSKTRSFLKESSYYEYIRFQTQSR